jgi:predicted Zn-dependent protease with MMP-like domain
MTPASASGSNGVRIMSGSPVVGVRLPIAATTSTAWPLLCLAALASSPRNAGMAGPDLSDPLAWRSVAAPTLDVIEVIADAAYRRLPQTFRTLCDGLVIRVEDFPTDEVLDQMGVQTEFDLLGLFQGIGLPFRSESAPSHMPNMIWLYRRPILDYWAEHEETLGAIITHVLVHEIGHHFGLSDDDMMQIEASTA